MSPKLFKKYSGYAIRSFEAMIVDALFPVACVHCSALGTWICERCLGTIGRNIEHRCPLCERCVTPDGRACAACRSGSSLDALFSAASYREPVAARAIHLFKYRFIPDLSEPLGRLLADAFRASSLPLPDLILPVPLHRRRLRWRGFNQAEKIATITARQLTPGFVIPVATHILLRIKNNAPQMSIAARDQRQKNVRGIFSVAKPEAVAKKRVLLIDDVATTGATLFECARILKDAGAKEVSAAVVAK